MPPVENNTPDLPPFDPKADRGNDFTPDEKVEIELNAEELKAVGLEPKDEEPKVEEPKAEDKPEDKKAEEPKAEERPRDKEGKFIPKARFDEVNNKAKARVASLEAENKALKERLGLAGEQPDTKTLETKLDEATEKYGALIAEGDLAAAKEVMREINITNRALALIEAAAMTSEHTTESRAVDALTELVDLYKGNYPVFDDSSDQYKQEYVDFVANLQGRFELTGSSPAEALREAVELAVAKFALDPEPEAEKEPEPAPTKGDVRKVAAVDKALKAAKATAPSLDKVGMDSDKTGLSKVDVGSLTYEQFNSLPESALTRLRGDLV